ncbi:MAG: class I SAM-dependent methyltransferase [Candidatus Hermodarchaeota archaeon]
MTSSGNNTCFYCTEYAKVINSYLPNTATKNERSFTPRCLIHWKFKCGKCETMIHFNGISWCSDCKEFTCLNCGEEKMVRELFLIYDYYYSIPCHKCGKHNPALDYAEYIGTHPFQNNDLHPGEDIALWLPNNNDRVKTQEFPHKSWGSERLISLGRHPNLIIKRIDRMNEYTSKSIWDTLAPHWLTVEEENYHHKYRILPHVYRMLNVQKGETILDVACGKGDIARDLTKSGGKVTGIDISKMLDYAIEREKNEKLGITYLKMNAERLTDNFDRASFDKIVCNMALMDIEDYKTTIQQIYYVLKENGIFVFSILHPTFSSPATMGLRIPHDSQRNEDRIRVILNYFDERPVISSYGTSPPCCMQALIFPRTISSYLNELANNNLILKEMREPKASKELVEKFPRNAYFDDEMRPEFLIVKSMKKSDIL